MSLVYISNTPEYDRALVAASVTAALDAIGVAGDVLHDRRIVIKPNLLTGRRPDAAVTTHPFVIAAVIEYVKAHGGEHITVADSPGGPYTPAALKLAYSAAGWRIPEIEPYLNYDVTSRAVTSPSGRVFDIITPLADADYIIDLCKLKTHAMTTVTCAIKNMFGSIPGLEKPDMHCRCPELSSFTEMLCDLYETVKPAAVLCDAVYSMEGNGPSGGDVRRTGVIFASRDGYALDTVTARFIGMEPENVPVLAAAKRMGLISAEPELAGDAFVPAEPPFRLPDAAMSVNFTSTVPAFLRKPAEKIVNALFRSFPHVDRAKCVGCGKCAESCPQKIITVTNGKASMPRTGCISCFCCQEMCPAKAISARRAVKLF